MNLGGGVCFSCVQPKSQCNKSQKRVSAIFVGRAAYVFTFSAIIMAMPQLVAAPRGFVNIKEISNTIHVDMAYSGSKNFLGRRVKNYYSNSCYLLPSTANALFRANTQLEQKEYRLSVRDCWRPFSASQDMSAWADEQDTKNYKKEDLSDTQQVIFEDLRLFDQLGYLRTSRLKRLGYLAVYSNHNKGSTVDIELLKYRDGRWELADTGTAYDVFSRRSAFYANVNAEARNNRDILAQAMRSSGFRGLATEWWHWTHTASNGDKYFDGSVD